MEPTTFAELGLSPKVLAAIEAAGYTTPTPIQASAIPVAVSGRDVLGIAQTGTGKTAAFVMPMITRLETGRARARMPRSLILAPTRELAAQVAQSFEKYGTNHKLTLALLIGGVSFDDQNAKLDRGVDVLIATPGRLLDHFQRGRLMLMGVEILVIDEADRMLDMGFIPDIERICKLLPPRRQTLFFSATMPPEITRLVSQFLKDPQRIEVAPPATTAKTITQRFRFCSSTDDWAKREVLRQLIRDENVKNAIIFCNRKRDVAVLHRSLVKHGFNAGALHGDMDQKSRTDTLDRFRSGEITLLAASDVAARGLDIPDVSHIFNFDLPWQSDDYVHRIGRTGRAGKEGIAASLVTPEDLKILRDIEQAGGSRAIWIGEPPTEQDFAESSGKRRRGRFARGGERGESREGRDRGGRGQGMRNGAQPRSAPKSGETAEAQERVQERPQVRAQERPKTEARPQRSRGPRPEEGQKPRREHGTEQRTAERSEQQSARAAERPPTAHTVETEPVRAAPREHRADHRPNYGNEPRAPREQGRNRNDQPRREHEARAPRPEGRPARHQGGERPERAERSERTERAPRPSEGSRRPGVGFAENVPAFLAKPVRRQKVANE